MSAAHSDPVTDTLAVIALLNRYGIAIDARDWKMFRTVFHDDVIADYGPARRWEGLDAFVGLFEAAHQHYPITRHMVTNHHIELAHDRAHARSYVHTLIVVPGNPGGETVSTSSYFDDELMRTPAGWRIFRRTLHPFWAEGNLQIIGYKAGEKPRSEPPWTLR